MLTQSFKHFIFFCLLSWNSLFCWCHFFLLFKRVLIFHLTAHYKRAETHTLPYIWLLWLDSIRSNWFFSFFDTTKRSYIKEKAQKKWNRDGVDADISMLLLFKQAKSKINGQKRGEKKTIVSRFRFNRLFLSWAKQQKFYVLYTKQRQQQR